MKTTILILAPPTVGYASRLIGRFDDAKVNALFVHGRTGLRLPSAATRPAVDEQEQIVGVRSGRAAR